MAKGKKTGGRTKGTPNKGGAGELLVKCQERGADPFDVMIDYIVHPGEPALRFAAAKELCNYIYPKRKSIEHSGEIEGITITVHDYTKKK